MGPTENSEVSKTNSPASAGGRFTVLAMLAIAILASAFAWAWNFNRGRKSLELYGSEGATLVRTAPKVEILRPEPLENLDISRALGLINARASLLSDASYEWSDAAPRQESPLFSVRFSRGDRSITLTFDFENRSVHNSATERTITLKKKTADGWQQYLARQIDAAKNK